MNNKCGFCGYYYNVDYELICPLCGEQEQSSAEKSTSG